MMKPFAVKSPAKINLTLETLGRRADGYTELRSLMLKVGLFDTLRLAPAPEGVLTLAVDVPGLSAGEDNLVMRAARLLQARAGRPLGARLKLFKRIPMAAGLAGGSGDAAAALAGLNRLWALGLGPRQLKTLAAKLGSDVPFCMGEAPACVARGRGERLAPVQGLPRLWVALAKPPVAVPTAWVFKHLRIPTAPRPNHTRAAVAALKAMDLEALQRHAVNDLETVTIPAHPVIAQIKSDFDRQGALLTRMSGSGPTVFALFGSRLAAQKAVKAFENMDIFTAVAPLL